MPIMIGDGAARRPAARSARVLLRIASRRRISSVARQASLAWSGSSSGAFQNAMMELPIYLSMVPSFSITASVIGVRKSLSRAVSAVASIRSEMVVKSRMSQNMMVRSRTSPPRRSSPGFATSRFTIAGAR